MSEEKVESVRMGGEEEYDAIENVLCGRFENERHCNSDCVSCGEVGIYVYIENSECDEGNYEKASHHE